MRARLRGGRERRREGAGPVGERRRAHREAHAVSPALGSDERTVDAATGTVPEAVFYGCGRPLQTPIALNGACVSRLEELAGAAGVSLNALAVAALHAGLPAAPEFRDR